MKGSTILSIVGVVVVILVIGMALGSVIFPVTKTVTSTLSFPVTSTRTEIVASTITESSYFVIYPGNVSATVTKEILEERVGGIQVEISGNCTVSGGTGYLTNTTTTEYLLPSYVSNSSENL